jgi:peptide/nickel transport system substrate-binding protein
MHRVLVALALAGVVLAGCGGEGGGSEAGSDRGAPIEGRQGGKLTMLWTDDVDNIDPGITYTSSDVEYAIERGFFDTVANA